MLKRLYERHVSKRDDAAIWIRTGNKLLAERKLNSACMAFKEAIKRAAGNRLVATIARHNIAAVYLLLNDHESAEHLLNEALAVFHKDHDLRRIAYANINLGISAAKRGSVDEAEAHQREAIKILRMIGDAGYAEVCQQDLDARNFNYSITIKM